MRDLARVSCFVLAVLTACDGVKPAEPKPKPEPGPVNPYTVDHDQDNLLNLAHGAAVISRTAELTLENSAAHAIDGDFLTFWKTPPNGAEQTLVFSLPARARIERLGVIAPGDAAEAPARLRFEVSDDAIAWRDAATIDVKPVKEPQTVNIAPLEAAYIRVHTVEPSDQSAMFFSILAHGRELAPPAPPRFDGCWTINGLPARFVQRGTSVAGVIGDDLFVIGGHDGRALRAMWRRGAMWGHAIVTVDPQGRALSGVRWFEDVIDFNRNEAWFGTPATRCGEIAVSEVEIANAILTRAKKWSMYGDDAFETASALIARAPSQRFRIVARNQARLDAARGALQSSRIEFVVEPKETFNEPQRVLADGVELHLR